MIIRLGNLLRNHSLIPRFCGHGQRDHSPSIKCPLAISSALVAGKWHKYRRDHRYSNGLWSSPLYMRGSITPCKIRKHHQQGFCSQCSAQHWPGFKGNHLPAALISDVGPILEGPIFPLLSWRATRFAVKLVVHWCYSLCSCWFLLTYFCKSSFLAEFQVLCRPKSAIVMVVL